MIGRLSPIAYSLLFLGVAIAINVLAINLMPIIYAAPVWVVSFIGFGIFRLLQRCPSCEASLAQRRIRIGKAEYWVFSLFPPSECPHCGVRKEGLPQEKV
jgi:hypothetical protein